MEQCVLVNVDKTINTRVVASRSVSSHVKLLMVEYPPVPMLPDIVVFKILRLHKYCTPLKDTDMENREN